MSVRGHVKSLVAAGALVCLALFAQTVRAQTCPADLIMSDITNCPSQDIQGVNTNLTNLPASCIVGESFDALMDLTFAGSMNGTRYDLGLFVRSNAQDLLLQGVGAQCDLIIAPTTSPFIDNDGDSCGDFTSAVFDQSWDVGTVAIGCVPTIGGVELQTFVDFGSSKNTNSCTPYLPSGPPKCFTETQVLDVEPLARLTVVKSVPLDNGSSYEFTYSVTDVPTTVTNPAQPFTLFNAGSQELFANLEDGSATFTVTEQNLPTGYVFVDVSCQDAGGAAVTPVVTGSSFDVTATIPAADITCTVTNNTAQLTIVKNTTMMDGTFDFTSTIPGNTAFSIETTSQMGSLALFPVLPGTQTIDETPQEGWTLNSATCTNGDDPTTVGGGVTLAPGDNVTCTFQNAPLNTVTIIKQTIGGDGSFDFVGDSPFGAFSIATSDNMGSQGFDMQIPAGSYAVTETVPAGWDLTAITCADGNSTGDVGTATAQSPLLCHRCFDFNMS